MEILAFHLHQGALGWRRRELIGPVNRRGTYLLNWLDHDTGCLKGLTHPRVLFKQIFSFTLF